MPKFVFKLDFYFRPLCASTDWKHDLEKGLYLIETAWRQKRMFGPEECSGCTVTCLLPWHLLGQLPVDPHAATASLTLAVVPKISWLCCDWQSNGIYQQYWQLRARPTWLARFAGMARFPMLTSSETGWHFRLGSFRLVVALIECAGFSLV